MISLFEYLEKTKGKPIPFKYKLINNLLTEDELIINGELWLAQNEITSLPDNLTVNGYLNLHDNKIKYLPNNLYVDGDLFIEDTQIPELPDDLYVSGDIWCRFTPLAEKIKKNKSLLEKYHKQVKGRIFYD